MFNESHSTPGSCRVNNLQQHVKVIANNLDGVFVMVCATTPVINAVKDSAEQSHKYSITIRSTFPMLYAPLPQLFP